MGLYTETMQGHLAISSTRQDSHHLLPCYLEFEGGGGGQSSFSSCIVLCIKYFKKSHEPFVFVEFFKNRFLKFCLNLPIVVYEASEAKFPVRNRHLPQRTLYSVHSAKPAQ